MTFRHGKDTPFPQMVRIRRLLKGAPETLIEGVIKATPAAERSIGRQIKKANAAVRKKRK